MTPTERTATMPDTTLPPDEQPITVTLHPLEAAALERALVHELTVWNGRRPLLAGLAARLQVLIRDQRAAGGRCPLCDSPAPHLHPAVQHGGECSICPDPFHAAAGQVTA